MLASKCAEELSIAEVPVIRPPGHPRLPDAPHREGTEFGLNDTNVVTTTCCLSISADIGSRGNVSVQCVAALISVETHR